MLDIIHQPPNLFLLRFDHKHELQSVLNEGSWLVFGHIFLLMQFKIGMDPRNITFDDYRIWLRFVGLPFLRCNEEDIRFLLKDFIPDNAIKPKRNQVIPASRYKVQTTLAVQRRVPTCINIEEEDGTHLVNFIFVKLPFFCVKDIEN